MNYFSQSADIVVRQNANIEGVFQLEPLGREKRLRQNQKVLHSRNFFKHFISPPFLLRRLSFMATVYFGK